MKPGAHSMSTQQQNLNIEGSTQEIDYSRKEYNAIDKTTVRMAT